MSHVRIELLIQEVHKSKSQPNACFIWLKTWNIQKSKKYLPFKIFIAKWFKPLRVRPLKNYGHSKLRPFTWTKTINISLFIL